MIKRIITLFLFTIPFFAKGNITTLPFSFTLTTAKEVYLEGEKVEFILTITNKDSLKSHPILLPGNQNYGNKLIFMEVLDVTTNTTLVRAKERREINMVREDMGAVIVYMLKPNETVTYSFYWNDSVINTISSTASHHQFDIPLFAGTYNIRAFYCPKGVGKMDTVYQYISSTHDKLKTGKLAFWDYGVPLYCALKIRKAPPGSVTIQGVTYYCSSTGINYQYNPDRYFEYKTDSLQRSSIVMYAYGNENSFAPFRLESYTGKRDSLIVILQRDNATGNILFYNKYQHVCPYVLSGRNFGENGKLVQQTDTDTAGFTNTIDYDTTGRMILQKIYYPGSQKGRIIFYHYPKNQEPFSEVQEVENICHPNIEVELKKEDGQ